MMKALVFYDSQGGNTEKVANEINRALLDESIEVDLIKVAEDVDVEFYDYDLIFLGSPVIAWSATDTMRDFVLKKLRGYHGSKIRPSAPLRPGKFGVSFCTYSGTHIGETEAVPLTKWFSAFLEHLGCQIMGEWNIVGEFHGRGDTPNVDGRLGDIRGRPNDADLAEVANRVKGFLAGLEAWRSSG
jgi:multimeric flavodoxin WrbA